MSDAQAKLNHELEVAQRALAEAEARYLHQKAGHQCAIEEVEKIRRQIEQAHDERMPVLDAMEAPIFVHDRNFRVLRCNKAYQRSVEIPYKEIIGLLCYSISRHAARFDSPLTYLPTARTFRILRPHQYSSRAIWRQTLLARCHAGPRGAHPRTQAGCERAAG